MSFPNVPTSKDFRSHMVSEPVEPTAAVGPRSSGHMVPVPAAPTTKAAAAVGPHRFGHMVSVPAAPTTEATAAVGRRFFSCP